MQQVVSAKNVSSAKPSQKLETADDFLKVVEVQKIYNPGPNQVKAVNNVSFTIGPSEFVSLLGPSGCGKSTMLMMAAGLLSPTSGTIQVNGTPMTKPRTEIGVMFQDATLLPWKSALENVLYPARILKLPLAEYREKAQDLREMVDLSDFKNSRPAELSGGMRQRVSICRALVYDPKLLLMDEPFGALDAITRDEMNKKLLDIWEQLDTCALFVTHSIPEAVILSDRVLVMDSRPSTITAEIVIPFPRPRSLSLMGKPEFAAICSEIRDHIEAGYARGAVLRSAQEKN